MDTLRWAGNKAISDKGWQKKVMQKLSLRTTFTMCKAHILKTAIVPSNFMTQFGRYAMKKAISAEESATKCHNSWPAQIQELVKMGVINPSGQHPPLHLPVLGR